MRQTELHRGHAWLFWLGIAVYAITYLALYPRVPAIVDENAYLTQALLLRTGHLSYDGSGIPAPEMSVNVAGRTASKYPPGNSAFLLLFTLPGWRWVFVSGLLLAVAGAWLFRLVLRRLEPEADPAWSLLYLLYPAVVLYSRTIMSDLPAATAILAGFYLLVKEPAKRAFSPSGIRTSGLVWNTAGAGLCLGFACLVRYSAVVLVPAFLLLLALRSVRRLRDAIAFCLGLAPFGLAILAYNAYCYGGPFEFPMYLTGRLSPVFLTGNLAFYVPCLLVLYPLMLIAPLATGRERWFFLALPGYALVLPYCFFSYTPTFSGGLAGLAVGLRYLIPAVPFFVLGFVLVLHRLETRAPGLGPLKFAVIAALLLLNVAVQLRHDRYLAAQDHYRRRVLESVPGNALLLCNAGVSELLNVAWGWRDNRHIAEYNVPMPVDRAAASRDTVYAALLQRPGRVSYPERAILEMLLARFPGRELVAATERPYWFRVYRLKPGG